MISSKSRNSNLIILLSFFLVIILYHLFAYIGHYGYDDMLYAKTANDFLAGQLDFNKHFSFRFPIILLTALSYSIFGISDFASALPSIIITGLTLLIVYQVVKKKGAIELILALSLTALSNWFIFYSDKLMPDIYIAFSVMLSLFIIYRYKYISAKKPFLYSLFLAISLLFGFSTKGTIVLIIPLLAYLAVVDILLKRDVRFWIFSALNTVLVLILYFVLIWILTGNFKQRFEAIADNSYLNLCSYDQQSFKILLKRISYEFLNILNYQGMLIGFIIIIACLPVKKLSQLYKFNDDFSFFLISSLILLLSSNFMTISMTSYSPMCLDPRHYLFLIPVSAIPSAKIISEFIKDRSHGFPLIIILFIVSFWALGIKHDIAWKYYVPLTLLFIFFKLFETKSMGSQIVFLILFIGILLTEPLDIVIYARKVKYNTQKELFTDYALKHNEETYVITNEVQKNLGKYYQKFNPETPVHIYSYDEIDPDTLTGKNKILFLNWYTRYLSNDNLEDLPYYAKKIIPDNELLYHDQKLNIQVYKLDSIYSPENSGRILSTFKNDFEKEYPQWVQDNNNITDKYSFDGENSLEIREFSSTFQYSLDSVMQELRGSLFLQVEMYCNYADKTDSELVVSIENKEGVYYRESLAINKYLKAFSNWWNISFEAEIPKKDLKESSLIKVYIWNIDKQSAYLDDFEVTLIDLGI